MKRLKINQYPTEILLRDEVWQVSFKRKLKDKHKDTVGLCDHSSRRIKISTKQSHSELFRTYIHELLHAIDDEYNIKLKHKQVYKLEEAIASFFEDNF